MGEIGIDIERLNEKECIDNTEKATHVAISSDGSIVATFNPCKL